MGIVCSLYRAPDVTLDALLAQPGFFHDFEMLDEKPISYEVKPGLIGRILGKKPRVVKLGHDTVPFERITENDHLYLDKAWHVLHYLMTGGASESTQALGFLLSGGAPVGEQMSGCDVVPRVFRSAVTQDIAREIGKLTEATLAAR